MALTLISNAELKSYRQVDKQRNTYSNNKCVTEIVKTAIVIKETRQYQRQDRYVREIRLIFKQKSCFLIYRESKAE